MLVSFSASFRNIIASDFPKSRQVRKYKLTGPERDAKSGALLTFF